MAVEPCQIDDVAVESWLAGYEAATTLARTAAAITKNRTLLASVMAIDRARDDMQAKFERDIGIRDA